MLVVITMHSAVNHTGRSVIQGDRDHVVRNHSSGRRLTARESVPAGHLATTMLIVTAMHSAVLLNGGSVIQGNDGFANTTGVE